MQGGTLPKPTGQLKTKWARHLRQTPAVQGALELARSTYEKPAPKPKPKKPKAAAKPKKPKAKAKKTKAIVVPHPPPPPVFKEPSSLTPPPPPAEFLERVAARSAAEAKAAAISPAAPAYKKAPPGVRDWLRFVWTFHKRNPSLTRKEAVQAAAAEYSGHPNDYSHPKHEYPESEADFAD